MIIQSNFKLEKWLKEFERIGSDILYLKRNNTDFLQLAALFNDKKLDQNFWEFAKRNYVSCMSMAIRRIAGTYRDGISLYKLLVDLRDNAKSVTRTWFLKEWPGAKNESIFVNFFGSDLSLKDSVVTGYIEELDITTKAIRDRADQFEAHIDLNPKMDSQPTFNDIDKSVDIIVKIYKKFYYLFKQASINI